MRDEVRAIIGTLHLLNEYPTLMPEAPSSAGKREIVSRVHKGGNRCFRCGGQAEMAFVAKTKYGRRWIDACSVDGELVREAMRELDSA